MTVSKFMQTGMTYIKQAAEYLDARGLTIQETPIEPYLSKNLGLKTAEGAPFFVEGWAFKIKDKLGNLSESQYLLRVCNWPDGELFRDGEPFVDRPKFVHVNLDKTQPKSYLYWCAPWEKVVNNPVVLLHEKITSAALTQSVLGISSLAMSGCYGFMSGGGITPAFEEMLKALATGTKLVVCLDGDITSNPDVMNAAAKLAGYVHDLRPDITVAFPLVPRDHGWDDFITNTPQELRADALMEALTEEGITVDEALPVAALVQKYGLTAKKAKSGGLKIEHSFSNYQRMLRHPEWADICLDISGEYFYKSNPTSGLLSFDSLTNRYLGWLERSVYRGDQSAVRANMVDRAILYEAEYRRGSVPLQLIEMMDPVDAEEARAAAYKLITEGMKVIGPMTTDETIETLFRIARDCCMLWSNDPKVDVQWVMALVGPSGCGKSNFPHSTLSWMADQDYIPNVTQLSKDGPRATISEMYLQVETSLHAVVDEYNPSEGSAKEVELNLFTLSSTRAVQVRRPYGRGTTRLLRHSALFLTTVDKNRTYIRSGSGEGAERRYITFEVEGVVMGPDGKLTSNRQVIKECWAKLLRYGYQRWQEGDIAAATEFSHKYAHQYIDTPLSTQRVSRRLVAEDFVTIFKEFGKFCWREGTQSWRFSLPQIINILYGVERMSRAEQAEIRDLVLKCGALHIGQARVNCRGGDVMKDSVYDVNNWQEFCEQLFAKVT